MECTSKTNISSTSLRMKNENLYDYVLHYNPYIDRWCAIPRDSYLDYWNNKLEIEGLICSPDLNVVIELINRGSNFVNSIK